MFAQESVKEALKGVTDPITNLGGLALLAYFLIKVVPVLVKMIISAMTERDDKFAKIVETIQVKQDDRNEALVSSIKQQTKDLGEQNKTLGDKFDHGFQNIKDGLLSACRSK